jgi:hypothetical protein
MSALPGLPHRAIVYVDAYDEAIDLKRRLRRRFGTKCAGQWSIVYGDVWREWGRGTAKLANRPFVDLSARVAT